MKPYLKNKKHYIFNRFEVYITPHSSWYITKTLCDCWMISFYKIEITIMSKKCYNAYRKIEK